MRARKPDGLYCAVPTICLQKPDLSLRSLFDAATEKLDYNAISDRIEAALPAALQDFYAKDCFRERPKHLN
jgi:hypothetical protein